MEINKRKILNALYPITNLLGLENIKKNVECPNPEHNDKHPSAHIYNNAIWCFRCRKLFKVCNIIEYNNFSFNKLYSELEEKYGDDLIAKYEIVSANEEIEKEIEEIKVKDNEDFINFTKRFFENGKK